MTTHGIAALATLSIPGVERQFLDRQGRVIQRFPDSTPFTSWDAVFHQLRAAFPDESYHHGHECVSLSTEAARPVVEFASGVRIEADLVIGADGVGSVVRSHLFPEVLTSEKTPQQARRIAASPSARSGSKKKVAEQNKTSMF